VLDVATGKDVRIGETSEATPPLVSEDGTQVAYAAREKDGLSIYVAPMNGGVARRICTGCGRPTNWLDHGAKLLYDQAAKNTEIAVLDLASGKSTTILRAQGKRIYTPRLSPDGRLLCFTVVTDSWYRKLFMVPFRADGLIPDTEWKPVTAAASVDERQPFWAPGGGFLYFISEQDGFRCIWGVRFDAGAGKAIGEPFPVDHFHQYRQSLVDFGDVADIGLSVSGKTLTLALREIQANIWIAERKAAGAK
jgi:Tol biopolymer transport system component